VDGGACSDAVSMVVVDFEDTGDVDLVVIRILFLWLDSPCLYHIDMCFVSGDNKS